MAKKIHILAFVFLFTFCSMFFSIKSIADGFCDDKEMFASSLHSTTGGMKYWYSKENGGMELLTDIPYEKLACKKCHVSSCDTCHKEEKNKTYFFSTNVARDQKKCLKCHGRQKIIIKTNDIIGRKDVHFEAGMICMDCHTAKEVHGDGAMHLSMKEPGVIETGCINCHNSIKPSKSHTIHEEKLDCKACHNYHVVSCINCHMDTFIKDGKKAAIPVFDWIFLINYNGKVTSANTQTYVVDDKKTFIMFAPQHSHSIMGQGRECNDCHGKQLSKKILKNGFIKLMWVKKGKLENIKGVIPIVKNIKYEFVYQNYDSNNDEWSLIKKHEEPIIHYAGFGNPLSLEQLRNITLERQSD